MTIGTMRDRLIRLAETVRDMGADRVMLTGSLEMLEKVHAAILPGESRDRWTTGEHSAVLGRIDGVRVMATNYTEKTR